MRERVKKLAAACLAFVFCFSLFVSGKSGLEVHAAYISQKDVGEAQQYTKRAGLKGNYQKIYDAVYENVSLLEEDYPAGTLIFDFSEKDISFRASSGDTIYIPLGSMQDDHPELEWIAPGNLEAVADPDTGKLMGIRLRNTVTNARIEPYQDKSVFDMEMKRMDATIEEIIRNTEAFSTDYEKLLYIHDWLVTNNIYNCYVADDTPELADIRTWSAVSAFLSNNNPETGPVCEGYSEAFKILCEKLGIPCVLLTGMEHQWNAVELGGKWYAVDCTWDDPITSDNDPDYIRHDYFLVGTETKTLGGTSTYGEDHITYTTETTPPVNDKGLALVNGAIADNAVYDETSHGVSGDLTVKHGHTAMEGDFTFSYYKDEGDGWKSIGSAPPVDAGRYKVEINLVHDEYGAFQELTYEILPAQLSAEDIVMDLSDTVYSGTAAAKPVTVSYHGQKLKEGTDYTVTYRNNVDAGTAEIRVCGIGNYTGAKSGSFIIEKAKITAGDIGGISDFTYDGLKKTPIPRIIINGQTLREGKDYTVSYEGNCVNIGTSYVMVTGTGNYQGECKVAFVISEAEAGTVSASTNPDTGDTQNTVSWVAVMVLSLSAGILVLRKKYR